MSLSKTRIFLELFSSAAGASAIVAFLLGIPHGVVAILFIIVGALIGPALASPGLLFVGVPVANWLIKNDKVGFLYWAIAGIIVSIATYVLYGYILSVDDIEGGLFFFCFLIGGFLTGVSMWRKIKTGSIAQYEQPIQERPTKEKTKEIILKVAASFVVPVVIMLIINTFLMPYFGKLSHTLGGSYFVLVYLLLFGPSFVILSRLPLSEDKKTLIVVAFFFLSMYSLLSLTTTPAVKKSVKSTVSQDQNDRIEENVTVPEDGK